MLREKFDSVFWDSELGSTIQTNLYLPCQCGLLPCTGLAPAQCYGQLYFSCFCISLWNDCSLAAVYTLLPIGKALFWWMAGTAITALLCGNFGMCLCISSIVSGSPFHYLYLIKLFGLVKLSLIADCAFWASTLFTQPNTCLLIISALSTTLVSSLIISANMALSFSPYMNYSFNFSLSTSLCLHSTAANLSLSINPFAFSFVCLLQLWNCSNFMVSLHWDLNLVLNVVNKPYLVLHLSRSVCINDSMNWRPFLPNQLFYNG